ncbi:MAG: outer membrane lipoprotein carrier protein LolA [Flavobacteriales bacterium]|nr:outer membrane lipoprotein carrier protein LolA [Flavobacteriales bacterium]
MKRISLFILSVVLVNFAFAQTSKDILDKLSAKAKTYQSITSDFTMTLKDAKSGTNKTQTGSVKVKGQKYSLVIQDYEVFCDGVTVWTYSKDDNSCTIDNLEDVRDGSFDPSEMFTIWEKDFKHEMKNAAATADGIACYEIHLFPNNPKGKAYHTIVMYVDKAKNEVSKIVVKMREGGEVSYKVKNFKANGAVTDADFKFNAAKHPGVSMVDNRI